jgi:hypothetical protein
MYLAYWFMFVLAFPIGFFFGRRRKPMSRLSAGEMQALFGPI